MKFKYIVWCYLLLTSILSAATIETSKTTYKSNESIKVNFSGMLAENEDWIAIYAKGTNNDWGNVIHWSWTGDVVSGIHTFKKLPVGEYEVRAFFNNSYHTEAKDIFKVSDVAVGATVQTTKNIYTKNEKIIVDFNHMTARNKDWIAIYPVGASNDWDNVVAWDWTGDKLSGRHTFNALAVGKYEVRVFFNNSYHTEASDSFEVKDNVAVSATVTTNKSTYGENESIVASFNHMFGDKEDWIAIYPAGTNNEWDNVIQWDWLAGKKSGTHTFNALPAGNYDVRVFFKNTYHTEAHYSFIVKAQEVGDGTVILNEYNAASAGSFLKGGGSDSHFGRVAGNGGSWLELVVTGEHVDLRGVNITIKQDGVADFRAKLPQQTQLGHLRRGTILTISNRPTDVSYAPFAPDGDDWVMNINANDLVVQAGVFKLSSNNVGITMIRNNGNVVMPLTGERNSAVGIDNQEVFKLKRNPAYGISPSDGNYGDDNNQKVFSTFGAANRWGANGQQKQNFHALRANQALTEIGGIPLSTLGTLRGIKDAESILYEHQNNSLWISDDNAHKVYEMDLTTKALKSLYTTKMLEDFSGVCRNANNQPIPNCKGLKDLESVVYDDVNDYLYIFVGSASSTPAIFKLTRNSRNDKFVLDDHNNATRDFRILTQEYQSAQFIEGEVIIGIKRNLYRYNFETDAKSAVLYSLARKYGDAYGMAYDNGFLWITSSNNYLLKIDWNTKTLVNEYRLADSHSRETYSGVYDARGIDVNNNKIYILEGINTKGGKKGSVTAPNGHALKSSVHIYSIP